MGIFTCKTGRERGCFFIPLGGRLALLALGLLLPVMAPAESWPPLVPPNPLTAEWVSKQAMTRYPEIHANHRRYLAALERVEYVKGDPWNARILEHEAEIARFHAIEHHLALQSRVRQVFYDYWQADQARNLINAHMRLWEAYIPAGKARAHQGADSTRDFTLETARLQTVLLAYDQDRVALGLKLNVLLDRRHDAPLSVPTLQKPKAPPGDRAALVEEALAASPAFLRAGAEVRRAEAVVEAVRAKARASESLAAALHELAGWQQQRRAIGAEVIREVMVLHEAARGKRDALATYEETVLPRADQQVKRFLAAYQAGSIDLVRLLEGYASRFDVDLEMLRLRVEYEKTLAELDRVLGRLPSDIAKRMSAKPLNIGGKVK